ncbi:MAG: heme-binding protein [Betaproteobacteria bacterium]|nr:heme-binding protein [Betaproteobacteria bacterium]
MVVAEMGGRRGGALTWVWLVLALALCVGSGAGLGAASAAANPADPQKVLRIAFPTAESGFDPVRANDLYSNTVTHAIFHTLMTWDWMAKPARLVPYAAEAMPEVSEDGTVYTFKVRKGLLFTPDPAFGGKRREVTAEDFAYTLRRHADPRNRSPQLSDLEDKIVGFAEAYKAAVSSGNFDDTQRIAGIEVPDRYTLRLRLLRRERNFLSLLANPYAGAMAREVVEHYGQEAVMANPVGSGPYRIEKWVRGSKIVLAANPDFPAFVWDFEASPGDEADQQVARQMRGRKMPQIGKVDISIIEEPQSAWLAFSSKSIDAIGVPPPFIEKALDTNQRLLEAWREQGVGMYRSVEPDIRYQFFNLKDPVIGGYTKEKIALRRAIIMGYDVDEEIRVIRKNQAVKAEQMVSPVIPGHDPGYRSMVRHDPGLANALLDQFNYRKGPDGFRMLPDGKPLVFTIHSTTSSIDRERDELWKRSMDRIGIRLEVKKDKFPELLKQGKQCAIASWSLGWTRSSESEFVMKLLYSRTIGQNNYACFESADYDRYFEELKRLPDGAQRTRVLHNLYRLMEVYGVLGLSSTSIATRLHHPWVEGYRKHPLLLSDFHLMDIRKR